MLRNTLVLLLAIVALGQLKAQGIKGKIKDNEGNPLPFASIYVKQVGTGTSSNLEGDYELPLSNGTYDVTFQFMGYASQQSQIKVSGAILL